jgi:hypothetical protein
MNILLTCLVALSFFARAADETKPQPAADLGPPDVVGVVEKVSSDGKTLDVKTESPRQGGGETTVQLKRTDKTRLVFTSVGPGDARIRKGSFIAAWLSKGSKDTASCMHLAGTTSASGQAPDHAGLVGEVAADGKSFTLLPAGAADTDRPEKFVFRLTGKTRLTFFHVPANGARLEKGMRASVWLAKGSKETAARVRLYAAAAESPAGASRTKPAYQGKVTQVEEGKRITLEVPAKEKRERPTRKTIALSAKTQQLYENVPHGGASPKVGYTCVVWLGEGAKAAAIRVTFINPPHDTRGALFGQVAGVANDGKSFTLVQSGAEGEEGMRSTIHLPEKARVIYHDVGLDGARPTKGYSARVWLAEGSKDAAAVVVFEGKAG